jgi:hypothetical protein
MAVRPLVTTGAALLSAGALVAATPALFVPNDEVKIAAPAAAEKSTLSVDQLRLLALSNITPQALYQVFFQGYGGIVTGDPADPDNCAENDDAVCPAGFVGVPYFIIDQVLPPGFTLDNVFFEQGIVPIIQGVVVALAESIPDPTGRLDLVDRVNDFFEGGVTQLVGNLLLDNLSEGTVAFGLTQAFFDGYGAHNGFVGAFTYVVDAIVQGTATPDPRSDIPDTTVASTEEEGATDPELKTGDPADPTLAQDSLITLTTNTDVKTPFGLKLAKLAETPVEPEVKTEVETEVEPVKTGAEEEVTTGEEELGGEVTPGGGTGSEGTGVTTPGAVDPVNNVDPTTDPGAAPEETDPVKVVKDTEPTTEDETVNTKGGNKVTPGVIWETGRKHSGNSWEKFGQNIQNGIDNLNKIFNKGKPAPKPAGSTTGTDDGGSEGGGEGGGE